MLGTKVDTSRYMYVVQLSQLPLVVWNWNYAESYTYILFIPLIIVAVSDTHEHVP